jgi:hypothetical protein
MTPHSTFSWTKMPNRHGLVALAELDVVGIGHLGAVEPLAGPALRGPLVVGLDVLVERLRVEELSSP